MIMAKIYARQLEEGKKNYNQDIINNKNLATRNLSEEIKQIIESDGYIILEDGMVTIAPSGDSNDE